MPDGLTLEFTDPAGDPLRIDWSTDALAGLVAPTLDGDPPWRLGGELDWDELDGMRILSGRLGPDRLLAIAALRPRGAEGHGDELVAGALGGGGGELEQLDEILLSTEYGADGAIRRLGLELYPDGAELPLRVAGNVVSTTASAGSGVRRDSAAFELRAGADEGVGILDVLTQA